MIYLKETIFENDNIQISNNFTEREQEEIIAEIVQGLTCDQKYILSKYFYDERGSKLFEDITRLPEYYPTRTEKSILRKIARQISRGLKNIDIVELGSGDCSKISLLLHAIPPGYINSIKYIPVDVSHSAMEKSLRNLSGKYSGLQLHGMLADFMKPLEFLPSERNRLFCFFGSTLGNLLWTESMKFMQSLRSVMIPGDQFLLGVDLAKDISTIERAYNDTQGVTEAFNKNILNVVNSIADTSFNPNDFEHLAFFDSQNSRIEMHLKALKNLEVDCKYLNEKLIFNKGETIHTENSHKFSIKQIDQLAQIGGLKIKDIFCDQKKWFSIIHLV